MTVTADGLRQEREEVVTYLNRQLIGPLHGPAEQLDGNPLDRYLLGVLYPQLAEAGAVLEEEEEEATSPADDEESEADNPISMAFERLPASLGISFYVTETDRIRCSVWAGAYHLVEKVKANEVWKRESLADPEAPQLVRIVRPPNSVSGPPVSVLGGRASLYSIWRPLGGGFLVTVTLVNACKAAEVRPNSEECLFQVGLSCAADGGRISDYPRLGASQPDAEEEELALLYQDRRVYAVGHGTAAIWSGQREALTVTASALPTHETFPVTRDLAADGPKDRMVDAGLDVLSLALLADDKLPPETLHSLLRQFVARYQAWIDDLVKTKVEPIHLQAASRIDDRLRTAARRMNRGIECLEQDTKGDILRAFRLATRAMLIQMVHSKEEYGGKTRKRDERPFVEPAYAGPDVNKLRWYPFQLAFQLLTLESVIDSSVPDRDVVDLIWFPTGGGKTEAYLWVAALEMFLRRLRYGSAGGGTAVIKRYTLRLLTSQQFQRAATLICACERLRLINPDLGTDSFTLGLWIGGQSTANTLTEALEQYEDLIDDANPENPFQLQRCPWCGTRIVPETQEPDPASYGVRADHTRFDFYCPTSTCPFHERLPIAVIDEELFKRPPSLLIGTIDKFARLAWDARSSAFFGGRYMPPGLIIQDELHLISGPLGTIAGVYEAAIDCLLTRKGSRPKIIAATATIRRAADQAQRLYARKVAVFPPSGRSTDDSYFARTDRSAPGRLYIGAMGQGHTPVTSLVRAAAAVCQAPQELKSLSEEAKDGYWTALIYHNSKRELGKTMALARDDIPARIQVIAEDGSILRDVDNVEELSANLPGRRIPEVLLHLAKARGDDAIDILPCTNMISVGVDVKRLGLMLVVGQPKSTAEYIQATSRVGRDRVPGLVVTMYSPTKPRDRSHYESFVAYHDALYRWVEPTSVTPLALPSRERALHAALVILARHAGGLPENSDAGRFDPVTEPMKTLIEWLGDRAAAAEPAEKAAMQAHLQRLVAEWASRAQRARTSATSPLIYAGSKQFETLLCTYENPTPPSWRTLNSMRHVDSECRIRLNGEQVV